jgi:hypothetical protein
VEEGKVEQNLRHLQRSLRTHDLEDCWECWDDLSSMLQCTLIRDCSLSVGRNGETNDLLDPSSNGEDGQVGREKDSEESNRKRSSDG